MSQNDWNTLTPQKLKYTSEGAEGIARSLVENEDMKLMAQSGPSMTQNNLSDGSKDRIKDTSMVIQCEGIHGKEDKNICDALESRILRAIKNHDRTLNNTTSLKPL